MGRRGGGASILPGSSGGGVVTPGGQDSWLQLYGYQAGTFDPKLMVNSALLPNLGSVHLMRVPVAAPKTVSAIDVWLGSKPANGALQTYLGIYSVQGSQLALSGEHGASYATTQVQRSASIATTTLTTDVYVAFQVGTAASAPGIGNYNSAINNNSANINTGVGSFLYCIVPGGLAPIPASLNMASQSLTNSQVFWAGLR